MKKKRFFLWFDEKKRFFLRFIGFLGGVELSLIEVLNSLGNISSRRTPISSICLPSPANTTGSTPEPQVPYGHEIGQSKDKI
jgi:hypothetical protein